MKHQFTDYPVGTKFRATGAKGKIATVVLTARYERFEMWTYSVQGGLGFGWSSDWCPGFNSAKKECRSYLREGAIFKRAVEDQEQSS